MSVESRTGSRWRRWRSRVSCAVIDGLFKHGSTVMRRLPGADPGRWGVGVVRDLVYGPHPQQRLDVYRAFDAPRRAPVVLYVHGGAWRMLSKESHFMMGIGLARAGYVVVNVDYRLAPEFRYPTPLRDCLRAYAWTLENVAELGGDPTRVALAGDSAGANLVTSMAVALGCEAREPWVHDHQHLPMPAAVSAACGIYEVRHGADLDRPGAKSWFIADYLESMRPTYVGRDVEGPVLADPVVVLEQARRIRSFPPFFLGVGTWDPLIADTMRLQRALEAHGGAVEVRTYERGLHAFHAFAPQQITRAYWADQAKFLRNQTRIEANERIRNAEGIPSRS